MKAFALHFYLVVLFLQQYPFRVDNLKFFTYVQGSMNFDWLKVILSRNQPDKSHFLHAMMSSTAIRKKEAQVHIADRLHIKDALWFLSFHR